MNPTAALLLPEVEELIHAKAFGDLREVLHGLQPADVGDIFIELTPEDAAVAFRVLPQDDAGEVFSYLPSDQQERLIMQLGKGGENSVAELVEGMNPDDRVKLLDELPPQVAGRIVASLSPEERARTQAILGYPLKSVGRLMTPELVRIHQDWTAGKALEHVRRFGRDAETINVLYVVDDAGKLTDDLRLRQVIMSEPDASIESMMNRQFVALRADQPQEAAVEMLQKYDRVALPVLDSRGYLLGIVTHDDVADVAQAEATEDMQKMGGVQALDEPYITAPIFSLVRKRAPWLALLFMSELLTTSALGYFEGAIAQAAVLATFIPAIISSGGNSGSQASTLVIRALALKEIELSDWFRVLRRELATAVILGLMVGAIGLARVNLFGAMGWFKEGSPEQNHFTILAVAISSTLVCVVLWGSIMGAMLPLILKRCGLDPAGSSTPFVATLVDVTGIIIYFSIAISVLNGTILTGPRVGPSAEFVTPAGERFVLFTDSAGRVKAAAAAGTPEAKLEIRGIEEKKK